jgi:ATP synthase protein I
MAELPQDIKQLDKRIQKLKQKRAAHKTASSGVQMWAKALRLATDFVAPVFVGISIGYLLDKCFNTRILFVFIWAVFGLAAGMLNMWRAAQSLQKDIHKE